MKRSTIILTGLLVLAILGSCSRSHPLPVGTSLVSITFGSNHTAKLSAEQATLFARLKHFLRGRFETKAAYAAIPSNVVSVSVTAKAGDMPTVSGSASVSDQAFVTITLEVPNGLNREFIVAAFDASGNYAYWGRAFANLDGTAIGLPVGVVNLGSVSRLVFVSTGGSDSTGDGSEANPYRTITNAITVSPSFSGILVEAGTYDDVNMTNPETFPLQLRTGMALVGLGTNRSTVLHSGVDGIYGASGAFVDSVRIIVCDMTAIDDMSAPMRINNVLVDDNLSCGGGALDGIALSADSVVMNTSVLNPFSSGISITLGNPSISNSSVTGGAAGALYGIYVGTGAPTISGNTLSNATYGILVAAGTPIIATNTIRSNTTGVSIASAGSPTLTGNVITNNLVGIDVSQDFATAPVISGNSISCNTDKDLNISVLTAVPALDVSNNLWDHAPPTTAIPTCSTGTDICYTGILPVFTGSAVVASPCGP